MRKILLLALLSMLGTLTFAPAALAAFGTTVGGNPPKIPEYRVTKDGMLVIGGDVLIPCHDVVLSADPGPNPGTAAEQRSFERMIQERAKICNEAGFPPAGHTTKTKIDQRLPDTGGSSLLSAFAPSTLETLASFGTTVGGNTPKIPEYQVTKDGMLITGGDVLTPCHTLLQGHSSTKTATPSARAEMNQDQRKSVAACRANGFPPVEPTNKVQKAQRLPDTAGQSLLPVVAATMLVALGLAGLLLRSRNS